MLDRLGNARGLPARIGAYKVIELLGLPPLGALYKASDTASGNSVVIKLMTGLRGADRATLERFHSQAALEAGLQHPNSLAVCDVGLVDGSPYLVMEYVEGESLANIMESGRLIPISDKIGYIIEVCRALSYVHSKRIVHRNIKSAKVMILKGGGVKICDFGMAYIEDEQARVPTPVGQIVGAPTHMSPEQIKGEVVDARSDIFSTGVVLHELLTGSLPFQGLSVADTLERILHDPPRPFTDSLGSYTARLQEITFRTLAKDRGLRYQTSVDLAFDLGEVRERIAA